MLLCITKISSLYWSNSSQLLQSLEILMRANVLQSSSWCYWCWPWWPLAWCTSTGRRVISGETSSIPMIWSSWTLMSPCTPSLSKDSINASPPRRCSKYSSKYSRNYSQAPRLSPAVYFRNLTIYTISPNNWEKVSVHTDTTNAWTERWRMRLSSSRKHTRGSQSRKDDYAAWVPSSSMLRTTLGNKLST